MQPAALQPLPPLSVLGQRWVWANDDKTVAHQAIALAQQTGLPPAVAHVLAARGVATPSLATAFLNPRLDMLPDPTTLKDMDAAVSCVVEALTNGDKIGIFGDYDVDGTCATAILARYLRLLGVAPTLYIPDRLTEGYGPTPGAMETLAGQGVKLLLTVDTGTTAFEALERAQQLGLRVVVTDHHQQAEKLPPAAAILNPQRADDTSALQGLCGSGVVFYLLMGLNRALREQGFFTPSRPEPKLTTFLDLVALATVADVMPLTGTNRVLVAKGVQQLGTWQHRGLAALAHVAGVKADVSATTMAFALAPRLNAAGRIDHARSALDVLLAADDATAAPLAETLNTLNRQRQDMEKEILAEARIQAEDLLAQNPETLGLVLHAPHWHPGVVGIVAARIKEAFNRPTFVLGVDANGHLKGSGRSLPLFNLGAAVRESKATLLGGGGHAMAAGVTLQPENVAAFTRALNIALAAQLAENESEAHLPLTHRLAPVLKLEAATTAGSLTQGLVDALQQVAPFGAGNPEPVIALSQTRIAFAKPVGATGEHLKLRLADAALPGPQLDAVCFGAFTTPLGQVLTGTGGRSLTLAVTAKPRTFNGKPLLDVHIKDATEF